MCSKQWLLVEWVDERSVFSSYGVVSTDSLITEDSELHPGKLIYVRTKHGNSAQRAQILRISDDKQHIKEHKLLIERRDHQVQNMLSVCMRTIKEIKTDPLIYGSLNSSSQINYGASGSGITRTSLEPTSNSSSSDSEEEIKNNEPQTIKFPRTSVKTAAKLKRITDLYNKERSKSLNKKRRSLACSTPLPAKSREVELPKLMIDKDTQTDTGPTVEVPVEKIEILETLLHQLYSRFLRLVGRLNLDSEDYLAINSDEQNGAVASDTESNEQNVEANGRQDLNNSTVEAKCNTNARSLEVRRVSAHTTNNIEQNLAADDDMVPIGLGNATVPARVMNDINWDSYSSATRQLLQAVFPRKVLATHSLTGKKSPAFANLPAKKCLNPHLIDDIVDTVSERCGVPKRLVRSCITIKCTDEAKLYRNRLQGRAMPSGSSIAPENQENIPPASSSPETSHSSTTGSS